MHITYINHTLKNKPANVLSYLKCQVISVQTPMGKNSINFELVYYNERLQFRVYFLHP